MLAMNAFGLCVAFFVFPALPAPPDDAAKVTIALVDPSPAESLGRAIHLAKDGDLAAAIELAKSKGGDADLADLLVAIGKLSDDVLLQLVGDAGWVKLPKAKLTAKLLHVDAKTIKAQASGKEPVDLPRATFDALAIRDYARKTKKGTPPLLAALDVLISDAPAAAEKAEKLTDAGEITKLEDRATRMQHALDAAAAREKVERFVTAAAAGFPDPVTSVADFEALLGPLAKTDAGAAHAAALVGAAQALYTRQFDVTGGWTGTFTKPPKALGDGKFEFRYESLATPGDLADFTSDPADTAFIEHMYALKGSPGRTAPGKNGVALTEDCGLVHKARFSGPVTLEFTWSFTAATGENPQVGLLGMTCLRPPDGCTAVLEGMFAMHYDQRRSLNQTSGSAEESQVMVDVKQTTTLAVNEDGLVVKDGKKTVDELSASPILNGRIGFANRGHGTHTISKIVITGTPDPDWVDELKEGWVAQRVKKWKKD